MSSALVSSVVSDLRYIDRDWNGRVDDDSLRRGSTVLRRLIVDADLGKAWRATGHQGEPMIDASSLDPVLATIPIGRIQFASVGGAISNGIEIRGAFFANVPMSEEDLRRLPDNGPPSESLSLSRFVDAPAVVVLGERVSRRTLIHYVSNKLGGAHFDSSRTDRRDGHLFRLLDWVAPEVRLADRPIIYYELLSIGQAVAGAADVRALLQAIRT